MSQQLPSVGEPLVLADGTKIDPSTGMPVQDRPMYVEIPNARRAQEIVGKTRRRMADLPEPPKTMNAISVVLAYTMYGMSAQEIAIGTGLTAQQVANIRQTDAYKELEEEIVGNILDADAENVRSILAEASHSAARRVTSLLDSDDESIQLAASRDVLNRTGHASKDESRGKLEELRINVTIKDTSDTKPAITIDGETV